MAEGFNVDYSLVRDSRIMPSDKVTFEIFQGPKYTSYQTYPVVSSSNSNLNFNIQTANLNTNINKRMYLRAQIGHVCTFSTPIAPSLDGVNINPAFPFVWGSTVAPSFYTFQQLFSTTQLTINQTTLSQVTGQLLAPLAQLLKPDTIQRNNMTTNAKDTVLNYEDALNTQANVLGGYENSLSNSLNQPNGAIPLDFLMMSTTGAGGSFVAFNPLSMIAQSSLYFGFTVTEDLILSPLLFGEVNSVYNTSMWGVNTLNWIFNIGPDNRAIRCAYPVSAVSPQPTPVTMSFALATPSNSQTTLGSAFNNCSMIIQYCTAPENVHLPELNQHPLYEFPQYVTSYGTPVSPSQPFVSMQSSTISTKTIPDTLLVYFRKTWGSQTNYDSDFSLSIEKVDVTWNSNSGILASAQQINLYEMSQQAGSNQSWNQFLGVGNKGGLNVGGLNTPLPGSFLALKMGSEIQIGTQYAPSEPGQYQIQLNVQAHYQQTATYGVNSVYPNGIPRYAYRTNPIDVELVVILVNSGFLANEYGRSSLIVGAIKSGVIADIENTGAVSSSELKRMIGGGFFDSLKSFAGRVANIARNVLPVVRKVAEVIPHPYAQNAAEALKSVGFNRSVAKRLTNRRGSGHDDDYQIDGDYRLRD